MGGGQPRSIEVDDCMLIAELVAFNERAGQRHDSAAILPPRAVLIARCLHARSAEPGFSSCTAADPGPWCC